MKKKNYRPLIKLIIKEYKLVKFFLMTEYLRILMRNEKNEETLTNIKKRIKLCQFQKEKII